MKLKPIKINNVKTVTLSVEIIITKQFKIRKVIGLTLMELALRIIPCTTEFIINDTPDKTGKI